MDILSTVVVRNLPNTSWLDPSIIIQSLNLLVMGLFTFFVWRATKESAKAAQDSADVAKKSLEHSVKLFDMEKEERDFLNKRYRQDLDKSMIIIMANIMGQTLGPKIGLISEIKSINKPVNEIMIKFLNENEIQMVDKFFSLIDKYLENHWNNGNLNVSSVFQQNETTLKTESMSTFEELRDIYNQIF